MQYFRKKLVERIEHSWFRFLLVVLCCGGFSASLAESSSIDAERHLADIFYSEFRDVIEYQLDDSGLAPAEIERIAGEAASKFAHCVIAAVSKIDDPAAEKFLSLLSKGLSATEIDDEFGDATESQFEKFFENYESLVSPCRHAANSELGLPPE